MPYCSIKNVVQILAQSLTSAAPNNLVTSTDLMNIGNTLNSNQVPDDIVEQYIAWADEDINSKISEQYAIPLKEIVDFETILYSDISEYSEYIITTDYAPFGVGDTILLFDGTNQERHVIAEVVDTSAHNVFLSVDPIGYAFHSGITRVLRVKYPAPITPTSARIAAANIYEKYFASQSSPNESEYGKMLKKQAKQYIDNILEGRTILHGQVRIGRRFFNSNLSDRFDLPGDTPGDRDTGEL